LSSTLTLTFSAFFEVRHCILSPFVLLLLMISFGLGHLGKEKWYLFFCIYVLGLLQNTLHYLPFFWQTLELLNWKLSFCLVC
jgi:hypothetical protein